MWYICWNASIIAYVVYIFSCIVCFSFRNNNSEAGKKENTPLSREQGENVVRSRRELWPRRSKQHRSCKYPCEKKVRPCLHPDWCQFNVSLWVRLYQLHLWLFGWVWCMWIHYCWFSLTIKTVFYLNWGAVLSHRCVYLQGPIVVQLDAFVFVLVHPLSSNQPVPYSVLLRLNCSRYLN